MPDIAMCTGKGQPLVNGGRTPAKSTTEVRDCPKKETCYRYKAKPSEFRQAYLAGLPYDFTANECRYFLPMATTEKSP